MNHVAINIKESKDPNSAAWNTTKEVPSTIDEAIEKYGADVCLQCTLKSVVIAVQNKVRPYFVKGMDETSMQQIVDNFKPGVTSRVAFVQDPEEALVGRLKNLSDEDRAKEIERLMAKFSK